MNALEDLKKKIDHLEYDEINPMKEDINEIKKWSLSMSIPFSRIGREGYYLLVNKEGEIISSPKGEYDGKKMDFSVSLKELAEKAEKKDTTLLEESFGFKPFNNIRVKIAALDNDQLVITKGSQTWSFHKY